MIFSTDVLSDVSHREAQAITSNHTPLCATQQVKPSVEALIRRWICERWELAL